LWASAVFFAYALIAVMGLGNMWAIRYLGVFPGAIFFAATMITMIMNRPFVDEYARRGVSAAQQRTRAYIGHCFSLTSFWAAVFAALVVLDLVKTTHQGIGTVPYLTTQFGLILVALAYQVAYVTHIRRQQAAPGGAAGGGVSTPAG